MQKRSHIGITRKAEISISALLIMVVLLAGAALLILFNSGPADNLNDFSNTTNMDSVMAMDATLLNRYDDGIINFDDTQYKRLSDYELHILYDGHVSHIYCSYETPGDVTDVDNNLIAEGDVLCDELDESITYSKAPPRIDDVHEGLYFKIDPRGDTLSKFEGNVSIELKELYEFNHIEDSNLVECDGSNKEMPCYESLELDNIIKNDELTIDMRIGDKADFRIPFFRYNHGVAYPENVSDDTEVTCILDYYSNIDDKDTKISLIVDGNYEATIINAEQEYVWEQAIHCSESVDEGYNDFDVQVLSGDYDRFRVTVFDPKDTACRQTRTVAVEKGRTNIIEFDMSC